MSDCSNCQHELSQLDYDIRQRLNDLDQEIGSVRRELRALRLSIQDTARAMRVDIDALQQYEEKAAS